jgi:hypothetical protein
LLQIKLHALTCVLAFALLLLLLRSLVAEPWKLAWIGQLLKNAQTIGEVVGLLKKTGNKLESKFLQKCSLGNHVFCMLSIE